MIKKLLRDKLVFIRWVELVGVVEIFLEQLVELSKLRARRRREEEEGVGAWEILLIGKFLV